MTYDPYCGYGPKTMTLEDAVARIGELEEELKRLEFTEDEAALLKDQP